MRSNTVGPLILSYSHIVLVLVICSMGHGSRSPLMDSADEKSSTLKCLVDDDCKQLKLCKGNVENCFCNQKLSLCDWKDRTVRPRWRRSISDNEVQLNEDDIGPDTCGKDRTLLSNWFLTHGSPDLLEDPIPENVLPTFPNPYDDPNKPPLQPDEVSGVLHYKILSINIFIL